MRKCLTWSFSLFLPSGIENITVITCSVFLSIKQEKCKWRMLKGQLLIPHLLHHAELLKPSKLWAALICNKHSDKKITCYISMKYNRLHKYDRTLTRTIYNFREWIKLNRLLQVTTLFTIFFVDFVNCLPWTIIQVQYNFLILQIAILSCPPVTWIG